MHATQQQHLISQHYTVLTTIVIMSGYGEPDWVNAQQNTDTVADANVGEGVTAAQAPTYR
jgi:hypothetical protein